MAIFYRFTCFIVSVSAMPSGLVTIDILPLYGNKYRWYCRDRYAVFYMFIRFFFVIISKLKFKTVSKYIPVGEVVDNNLCCIFVCWRIALRILITTKLLYVAEI